MRTYTLGAGAIMQMKFRCVLGAHLELDAHLKLGAHLDPRCGCNYANEVQVHSRCAPRARCAPKQQVHDLVVKCIPGQQEGILKKSQKQYNIITNLLLEIYTRCCTEYIMHSHASITHFHE